MAEALAGDSVSGQPRRPKAGPAGAQYIWDQGQRGESEIWTQSSGPASSEGKGPSQGPSKRQRSPGAFLRVDRQRGPRIMGH